MMGTSFVKLSVRNGGDGVSRHKRASPRREREELMGSNDFKGEDGALLFNVRSAFLLDENHGRRAQVRCGEGVSDDEALRTGMEQNRRSLRERAQKFTRRLNFT